MNDYATLRPSKGASLRTGWAYHDIPGMTGNVHRKGTLPRVEQITSVVDVDGLAVCDLGCSIGGVGIGLAQAGAASVDGFDLDAEAVRFGNSRAGELGVNVRLHHVDLGTDTGWDTVDSHGPYGLYVWLSNWMWVAAAAGRSYAVRRLEAIANGNGRLVFETAERAGSMAGSFGITHPSDVETLLTRAGFGTVRNLGPSADGWHARHVFYAER